MTKNGQSKKDGSTGMPPKIEMKNTTEEKHAFGLHLKVVYLFH